MTKIARSQEQSFDFIAAEDQRQFSLATWKRDVLNGDFAIEGMGIKEAQSTDRLNESGEGDLLLLNQEELIATNVLGTQLVGRFAEVLREGGDGVQVKASGGGRVMADLKILQHALTKFGHDESSFHLRPHHRKRPNERPPSPPCRSGGGRQAAEHSRPADGETPVRAAPRPPSSTPAHCRRAA